MLTAAMGIVLALGLLACGYLLARLRTQGSPRVDLVRSLDGTSDGGSLAHVPSLARDELLLAATDLPNQFFALGNRDDIDQLGEPSRPVPRGMLDHAVAANGILKAAQAAGELSGRLVLVDDKTAAAIRAGTMMTDRAGSTVAAVRSSGGQISSLTRIRALGGTATAAVTLPTALSAMAMQAQLARMEEAIAAVQRDVRELGWTMTAERESQLRATGLTLAEAYRVSQRSGALDEVTWQQVAPLAHTVFAQQDFARRRLEQAVAKVRALRIESLSDRSEGLDEVFARELPGALAELAGANRHFLQFQALRVWRLSDTQSPALASHLEELRRALAEQPDPDRLRSDVLEAVESHPHLTAWDKILRPIAKGRVQRSTQGARGFVEGFDWSAITMDRQPARELIEPADKDDRASLPSKDTTIGYGRDDLG